MKDPIVLVDQPSSVPTRKVSAGLFAGAAASMVAWGLNAGFGITFPAGMESACAVLILFCIQYIIRDEMQPPQTPQVPEVPPSKDEP